LSSPATSYALISGSSSTSPARFFEVKQNWTWIQNFNPPSASPPTNSEGFTSNISEGVIKLTNDADVTISSSFIGLDDDLLQNENLGTVTVRHTFAEDGDFGSPDFVSAAIGTVITNTTPTITSAVPATMPAGWGQNTPPATTNVQTEVTYTNIGPFIGDPYIKFNITAIP